MKMQLKILKRIKMILDKYPLGIEDSSKWREKGIQNTEDI